MDERRARARQIQQRIRQVLLEDWNPVGFPVPEDEYDAYIGRVYRLLARDASPHEVAEFLSEIEMTEPGTGEEREKELLAVAHKLCGLDVRLHG